MGALGSWSFRPFAAEPKHRQQLALDICVFTDTHSHRQRERERQTRIKNRWRCSPFLSFFLCIFWQLIWSWYLHPHLLYLCVCVCMSLSLSLSVCVCLSTQLIRKMSHKSSRSALSGQSRVKASWRRVACAKSISQSSIYNLASSNSASKSFAPNENAVKISKIVSSERTQQTPDLFHLIILLQEEFNYEQSFHSQKNRNQFWFDFFIFLFMNHFP